VKFKLIFKIPQIWKCFPKSRDRHMQTITFVWFLVDILMSTYIFTSCV